MPGPSRSTSTVPSEPPEYQVCTRKVTRAYWRGISGPSSAPGSTPVTVPSKAKAPSSVRFAASPTTEYLAVLARAAGELGDARGSHHGGDEQGGPRHPRAAAACRVHGEGSEAACSGRTCGLGREELAQLLLGRIGHGASRTVSTTVVARSPARAREAVARTELALTPIASAIAASSRSA